MKIQNIEKKSIAFKDVYVGDVFSLDEIYYMKIIKTDHGNAVILESGAVVNIDLYTSVEEVEGSYVRKLH